MVIFHCYVSSPEGIFLNIQGKPAQRPGELPLGSSELGAAARNHTEFVEDAVGRKREIGE